MPNIKFKASIVINDEQPADDLIVLDYEGTTADKIHAVFQALSNKKRMLSELKGEQTESNTDEVGCVTVNPSALATLWKVKELKWGIWTQAEKRVKITSATTIDDVLEHYRLGARDYDMLKKLDKPVFKFICS